MIVLTACPVGLCGHLTRWLLEISAGVFVGNVNSRIRDRLWDRVTEMAGPGRAIMVFTARNEQRLDFKVHSHDWTPEDFDGVSLMRRPADPATTAKGARTAQGSGWSAVSRRRRFGGSS